MRAICTSLVSPYHQTLCREEQVLRSSLLLAYHTPTQDPYGQATLCSDGSLAGLSSVSLVEGVPSQPLRLCKRRHQFCDMRV